MTAYEELHSKTLKWNVKINGPSKHFASLAPNSQFIAGVDIIKSE